jgi:hypothetical protein
LKDRLIVVVERQMLTETDRKRQTETQREAEETVKQREMDR